MHFFGNSFDSSVWSVEAVAFRGLCPRAFREAAGDDFELNYRRWHERVLCVTLAAWCP